VLYLLLKVVSAVGMGLVLKRADARSLERLPLIRTNYAVAAIVGFFASVALNQTHISNQTALLAAVTGVLFVAGLLIWARAIQAAGLARSVVAMRTAVVIPIFAAVLIWHEQPSMLEVGGSFVALLALALVLYDVARAKTNGADSPTKTPGHQGEDLIAKTGDSPLERLRPTRRGTVPVFASALFWLVLLFLADGFVMIPALVFRKEMLLNETMPFQTVIFVSAFFVTTLLYYLRKPRLEPEALKWGALLGVANFGNYLFLVLALTALPGLVVYPVIAAGEVGLLAVAGVVLWKEKVGIRSWLGIALAVLALVLIQLGKAA
jgi:drug/metabolite transporter (DMT)-like permease